MRILDPDGLHPKCFHPDCGRLAQDGYCEALCCQRYQQPRAYCSEHSHRPARVLEILGHYFDQTSYTPDEVRRIVMAMWGGAGLVYESAGRFQMDRDIERERAKRAAEERQREVAAVVTGKES